MPGPCLQGTHGFCKRSREKRREWKEANDPETVRTKTDLASITLKKENIYFLTLTLEISMFLQTEEQSSAGCQIKLYLTKEKKWRNIGAPKTAPINLGIFKCADSNK